MAVELRVGLPSVDEPGFDLQLGGRKPLRAHAVEKPGSVGRHIGRLISPVVIIVVTEQADVRDEDSSIDIEPVLNIEVIPAVCFRHVLISTLEIPLANSADISRETAAGCRTGVVARRGGGKQSVHKQDSAAHVIPMEIASYAGLLNLNLTRAERLGGSDDGVVARLVVVFHIVGVEANFRSEEFRIEHCVMVAGRTVEPGKVTVCKRSESVYARRTGVGSRKGFGNHQGGFRRRYHRRRLSRGGTLRIGRRSVKCRYRGAVQ